MDQVKIGKFIKQKRKEKKIIQSELAEKLNVTDRAISKWENGICMPDSGIIAELCKILNITINDLFTCIAHKTLLKVGIYLWWHFSHS